MISSVLLYLSVSTQPCTFFGY